MAPAWLTVIAWLYLSACLCCAGIIAYDIAVDHRRQPMGVPRHQGPDVSKSPAAGWRARAR
jgi:hypothetical protein